MPCKKCLIADTMTINTTEVQKGVTGLGAHTTMEIIKEQDVLQVPTPADNSQAEGDHRIPTQTNKVKTKENE